MIPQIPAPRIGGINPASQRKRLGIITPKMLEKTPSTAYYTQRGRLWQRENCRSGGDQLILVVKPAVDDVVNGLGVVADLGIVGNHDDGIAHGVEFMEKG